MLYVDVKYLKLLNLPGFVDKSQGESILFNFRCPICGDSKKNKSKKRAYAKKDKRKNKLFIYCHNCMYSASFSYFLRSTNRSLYNSYRKDLLVDWTDKKEEIVEQPKPDNRRVKVVGDYIKIEELPEDHKARIYLNNRRMDRWCKWSPNAFYVKNFQLWINENYQVKYQSYNIIDERIVFPLMDTQQRIFGFQGRSLSTSPNAVRYLTVMLNDDEQKVYGMHEINHTQEVYVTEGIFDCLFLANSIAMLGSDINYRQLDEWFPHRKVVFVYDNEPTSKQMIAKMTRIAKMGKYGLVFWEKYRKEKDINDIVVNDPDIDVDFLLGQLTEYDSMKQFLKITEYMKRSI